MYVTDTTENVKELLKELEIKDDITKMRFLLYIFNLLNNNQINNKNEANPNLIEDDELIIFNFPSIGIQDDYCLAFLLYNIYVYNKLIGKKEAYEESGVLLGINYDELTKDLLSKFERLNFDEKLDVFSEIIIRYDNDTYFKEKITILSFDDEFNGFEIPKLIKQFKENIK